MRVLALLALLTAAPAGAESLITGYGVRGGSLSTFGAMNTYFGAGQGVLEGFVTFRGKGKLDYEASVSGYTAGSVEQGGVTCAGCVSGGTSGYQYTQSLTVIPVLGTVEYGPEKKSGYIKFGGGAGLYFATLDKELTFGDPSLQASQQRQTLSRVTAGPHLQVKAAYFFNKNVGLGLMMRYAYARLNERVFRYFQSAAPGTADFAQDDKIGNISGMTISAGLALRL